MKNQRGGGVAPLEWSASCPCGCLGFRAGLDAVKERNISCSCRSISYTDRPILPPRVMINVSKKARGHVVSTAALFKELWASDLGPDFLQVTSRIAGRGSRAV
jgi:hypothetical protein